MLKLEDSVTKTTEKIALNRCAGNLGLLSAFMERGLFTGHGFMAEEANHRDIGIDWWTNKDTTQKCSMIESLIRHDATLRFDAGGDIISVFVHGLRDVSNPDADLTDIVPLRSQFEVTRLGEERYGQKYIYAEHRAMKVLNGQVFMRCCEFFNLDVTVENDNPTSAQIISLFTYLAGFDTSSITGMKRMYDECDMKTIFDWDETVKHVKDIYSMHFIFGHILRTFVDLRLIGFDGQHRLMLMMYFITGYFKPNNAIPLRRMSFEEGGFGTRDESQMQVWARKMLFNVGTHTDFPSKPVSTKRLCADLHMAGKIITEAQSHHINLSWKEFIKKTFNRLGTVAALTFGNYWIKESKTGTQTDMVWESIMTSIATALFAEIQSSHRARVLLKIESNAGQDTSGWSTNESSTVKTALLKEFKMWSCVGHWIGNILTTVMYNLIRVMCLTPTSQSDFLKFFNGYVVTHPQRGTILESSYFHDFRNADWLRYHVHYFADLIQEHFMCRFAIEEGIIRTLRRTIDIDLYKEGLGSLSWPPSVQFDFEPSPKDLMKPTFANLRKSMNLKFGDGRIANRYTFALYATIVNDMFQTFAKYGLDPDFTQNPVHKDNIQPPTEQQKRQVTRIGELKDALIAELTANGWTKDDREEADELDYLTPEEEDEDGKRSRPMRYNLAYDIHMRYLEDTKTSAEDRDAYMKSRYNRCTREYLWYVSWCIVYTPSQSRSYDISMLLFSTAYSKVRFFCSYVVRSSRELGANLIMCICVYIGRATSITCLSFSTTINTPKYATRNASLQWNFCCKSTQCTLTICYQLPRNESSY